MTDQIALSLVDRNGSRFATYAIILEDLMVKGLKKFEAYFLKRAVGLYMGERKSSRVFPSQLVVAVRGPTLSLAEAFWANPTKWKQKFVAIHGDLFALVAMRNNE